MAFGERLQALRRARGLTQEDLAADLVFENILRVDGVSSGVDYGEFAAVPVGFSVMAVSGRTGRRIDDGLSFTDEAVEEGAFSDVGASDDCYEAHDLVRSLLLLECKDSANP